MRIQARTLGPMLDAKFSEDELKQLIAIIESPVNRKFTQMGADMQKTLVDKLVAETKAAMEPKVKQLEQSISSRLGLTAAPAAAPRAAKPASKAASK